MKAKSWIFRGSLLTDSKTQFANHPHRPLSPTVLAGVSGALILWLTGCASDPGGKLSASAPPALPVQARLNLGTIGIMEDTAPAAVSFATGEGVQETAGDRASRFAGNTINTYGSDPGANVLLSPLTLVATPFAALVGVISPNQRMNSSQMLTAQLDLDAALDLASRQESFRTAVIRAAKDTGGRELVSVGQARGDSRVDTLLQSRVEQVSLEQTGKGDASFALKIKTRNRLVRASDGVVLYERSMDYCSGTDLFIEWTRASAIDSVLQTGLRKIARDLASEMLSLYDTPILAGTAKSSVRSQSPALLSPVKLAGVSGHATPGLIQVADTGSAAFGIFATSQVARVSVQNVGEGELESSASVQQTEWLLDGMDKHPNCVVSLAAIAVAVPISIWSQGVEIAMRLSPEKVRQSNKNLSRAARADRLEERVALEVAQNLAPLTDQPLALVSGPLPSPGAFNALESTSGSPRVQFVSRRGPATRLAGTAIQIRITSAALSGEGEFNPRLNLCIKGEADLVRLSDGVKLCSFPMEYRSEGLRYTKWAANDADLFRKELKRGYGELGKALADHLVTRGIVPPERSRVPVLAVK